MESLVASRQSSVGTPAVTFAFNSRPRTCQLSTLQKHSRVESVGGHRFDDEKAEFGGLSLEEMDLLLSVLFLVVLQPLIDVLVAPLQHAIDEAGELVSHRGDGFWRAEFAAETAVLGTEVALASQQRGGPEP